MMRELGIEASAAQWGTRYAGLIDAYVVDEADADRGARRRLRCRRTR